MGTRAVRMDTPLIIMTVVFLALLACVLSAPMLIGPGEAMGLDGVVGRIDNGEKFESFDPLTRAVYTAGDVLCHQIESRSFTLNGNQLPVCARDTGLLVGVSFGMAIAVIGRLRPSAPVIAVLFLPMVVDGTLQLLTSYESNNTLRALTGIMAGLALALFMATVSEVVMEEGGTGR